MGDDKIDTILTEAGMAKVGHRKRFVHLVQKLRAAAAAVPRVATATAGGQQKKMRSIV